MAASGTTPSIRCDNHPMMSAAWRCDKCRKHICKMCTETRDAKTICLDCGGTCRVPSAQEILSAHDRQTGVLKKSALTRSDAPPAPPPPVAPPPAKPKDKPGNLAATKFSFDAAPVIPPAHKPHSEIQAAPAEAAKPPLPGFLQNTGPFFCKTHPQTKAKRRCESCKDCFCADCGKVVDGDTFCPSCPVKLTPLTREQQGLPPLSFGDELRAALKYPLSGEGKWILILGALFLWVAGFAGWRGKVFAYGYMYAYFGKACSLSALGREAAPGWPSFTNWYDDLMAPMQYFTAARLLSIAPALIFLFTFRPVDPMSFLLGEDLETSVDAEMRDTDLEEEMPEAAILRDPQANIDDIRHRNEIRRRDRENQKMWTMAAVTPYYVLSILGQIYLPMALLALLLFRNFSVLNPLFVFASIGKVRSQYFVAYAILTVAEILSILAVVLDEAIPFVGPIIVLPFWIFVMIVEMRVLGSLYFENQKKLNWFGRSDENEPEPVSA